MKLNLQRETLLKPLQRVIGVVDRKQTLPILSNVLLKMHNNTLSITGTDLEVELIGQTLLNDCSEEYKLTLPGRKLMDICRALPDNAPIELRHEKEKIVLRSGRSRFALSTLPAEDFPNIESHESHLTFTLLQHQLRQLLQRTYFAMAQQDVRYYLNGLLLEIHPHQLRAVATDGHRLATNSIPVQAETNHQTQIIVPRKGVVELLRLLTDNEEHEYFVTITVSHNHIRIVSDDFTFTSKLIEGRFPDYERVIPKGGSKVISIDRDELKQALNRTAILCNEKFKGVRFELRPGILRILANNPEQEAAEEEIVIEYAGDDLDIAFNVNYLLDIVNTIDSGLVHLIFSDSNSSVLFKEEKHPDDSAYVVMPMRL